ncbi:hypothetical protein MNV49_005754 [Pseudohyphozyma bogoriensis]|nr:hypothetical protein MNV49_005754 [Pseudohyphozyma bogoriensis]
METITFPLTVYDRLDSVMSITMGYVVQSESGTPLDVDKLDQAVGRVAEKWRMLAGRIVAVEDGAFAVSIPTSATLPSSYRTHTFTTSHSSTPFPLSLPALTPSSIAYIPSPPSSSFLHPSTPITSSSHASKQTPMLSLHITTYPDCTCIGLTLPHGVFDASGFGEVVHAIDAELNERHWDVPTLSSSNPLETAFQSLEPPSDLPPESKYWVAGSRALFARLVVSLAWEYWWQGAEEGIVFLGEDVANALIERVKKEVTEETGGKEWVLSGDVISAWVLKAAYLNEPQSRNTLEVLGMWSGRDLLSTATGTDLTHYPHNLQSHYELPSLPCSSLPTLPLSTLALSFRRALTHDRTLSRLAHFHATSKDGDRTVVRKWGSDAWVFINRSQAGLDGIGFGGLGGGEGGGGMKAAFTILKPMELDHAVAFQKLNGGYFITAILRKSRWAALRSELERMKAGETPRVA